MRRIFLLTTIAMVVLAACQAEPTEEPALPTLAVLPSETATLTPSPSPTVTETNTPRPTDTSQPTRTPSPTATDTPTQTLIPEDTATPEPTLNQTAAVIGTSTAAVEEAPIFATFTPAESGGAIRLATGTPQMVADLIINERQLQEEIDRIVAGRDDIESAEVDFVEDSGIVFDVTARSGNGVLSSGLLFVIVETNNGLAEIYGQPIAEEGEVLSQDFIAVITGPFLVEVAIEALDDILNQRLGETHNLETIVMTEEQMLISLLVPQQ